MYIGSWVDRWERKTGNRPVGFRPFKLANYSSGKQAYGNTIHQDAERPASKEFKRKEVL